MGGFVWEWLDHSIRARTRMAASTSPMAATSATCPTTATSCIDGLVFPDRRPSPGLIEYKKVIEPVVVEAADTHNSVVRITNRYDFVDLDGLQANWTLTENGLPIAGGALALLESRARCHG